MFRTENTAIAQTDGGLGNRLKCLASAMRFAGGRTDKVHIARWALGSRDDAGYDRILSNRFAPAPVLYTMLSNRRFRKISKKLSIRLRRRFLTEFSGWRLSVAANDPVPKGFARVRQFPSGDPDWRHIDFEYGRIPEPVRAAYAETFALFEPRLHILETLDAFFKSCGAQRPTVGVHLRTWNDAPERRSEQMLEEAASAMQSIKDQDADAIFFVSSDAPETAIPFLQERFGSSIKTFSKELCHPDLTTGMELAFCEMLILSRMNRLIVTKHSTFSETAWWLGGATAEIVAEIGAPSAPVLIEVGDEGWSMAYLPNMLEHLDKASSLAASALKYRARYGHLMTAPEFGPAHPDDVMIDVGANIGLASIPIALKPYARRIVAFEPIPENVRVLKAGLSGNGVSPDAYEIVEAAVGCPENGGQGDVATIFVPEKRTDNASLGGAGVANWHVRKHTVNTVQVPVVSLDGWFRSSAFARTLSAEQIRLLKIDVQGWEEPVFRGAAALLEACRPHRRLVIEFEADPALLAACNSELPTIVELLESYGMTLYDEDRNALTLSRARQLKSTTNVLARFE